MGSKTEKEQLSSIKMSINGIQLLFDEQHPLLVQNRDDSFLELGIKAYTQTDTGFNFYFDHDMLVEVSFQDEKRQILQIQVQPPQSLLPLKSVRLPFLRTGLVNDRVLPNPPGLLYTNEGEDYLLSMPPRSFIDEDKSQLVIPGDTAKTLRLSRNEARPENVLAGFSPSILNSLSPKDYQTTLNDYISLAYNSWRTTRYSSATGTWTKRDSEGRFDEEIMVALLSEAWERNEYARVFNEMRSSADLNPEKLTYRSSVFLGNLIRMTQVMDKSDTTETERIDHLIKQGDQELFLKPGLYQFAVDRGSEYLASDLLNFLDSLDLESVSLPILLGVMQNIYLSESSFPELDARIKKMEEFLQSRIIPAITHSVEGYFLLTGENQSGTYWSILAGAILIKDGQRTGDENISALGKALILSAVKLSDESAYLPASIEFANGAISALNKSLAPEETYWLINSNKSYPHHISLYKELGPGHWFYTLAQVNKINISSSEYRFNISFPRSRTHYLIFRGMPRIDPQEGMQLFGITWRNDSRFEVYSKGRYYNPENKTLMIKYSDDSVQRDIVIWLK